MSYQRLSLELKKEKPLVSMNEKISKKKLVKKKKNETMTENLLKLFNICYDSRCIPSIWRQGIIKPIPKGGAKDPFLPLNYRGITLVSCVYKIFSSLINTRVLDFLEQNKLLVDEQNGFRSGRSCSDHLFSITSIVRKRLETGSSTFCAFIDL